MAARGRRQFVTGAYHMYFTHRRHEQPELFLSFDMRMSAASYAAVVCQGAVRRAVAGRNYVAFTSLRLFRSDYFASEC